MKEAGGKLRHITYSIGWVSHWALISQCRIASREIVPAGMIFIVFLISSVRGHQTFSADFVLMAANMNRRSPDRLHLLLGVLHEEEGLGGQVLRGAGVTLEKAREVIKQLLDSAQPDSTSEPK